MSHRRSQSRTSSRIRVGAPLTFFLAAVGLLACSNDDSGTQGSAALFTGGSTSGVTGAVILSGGTQSTGGVVTQTGGVTASGGFVATGGVVSETGGVVTETGGAVSELPKFSFFVTSLESMRMLSGSQDGFGGNYGGLAGADQICQDIAEHVGFGAKTWRAFLSVNDDGGGNQVNAIDRIGQGPWYDRNERLIAMNIDGLINRGTGRGEGRPDGDSQAISDLADEYGQGLDSAFGEDDNHDIVTGSNEQGELYSPGNPAATCNDWTSTDVSPGGGRGGGVRVGHAWPAGSGYNWISAHGESSCKPGVNLVQNGPGDGSSIGAGGGWGAIYCFALQP